MWKPKKACGCREGPARRVRMTLGWSVKTLQPAASLKKNSMEKRQHGAPGKTPDDIHRKKVGRTPPKCRGRWEKSVWRRTGFRKRTAKSGEMDRQRRKNKNMGGRRRTQSLILRMASTARGEMTEKKGPTHPDA